MFSKKTYRGHRWVEQLIRVCRLKKDRPGHNSAGTAYVPTEEYPIFVSVHHRETDFPVWYQLSEFGYMGEMDGLERLRILYFTGVTTMSTPDPANSPEKHTGIRLPIAPRVLHLVQAGWVGIDQPERFNCEYIGVK